MTTAMKNVVLAASLTTLAAFDMPAVPQTMGAAGVSKSSKHKSTVQQRKKHSQTHIAHGPQNRKQIAGEAATQGRKGRKEGGTKKRDIREDNRGRLTSANRTRSQHQQGSAPKIVDHKKHKTTVGKARAKSAPRTRTPQHRTAELRTGQLTKHQAAHLKTKEISLHREIHSDRKQVGGKLPPEGQTNQQPDKNANQLHLKKHNARTF
jgi:hypothetical protein